MHGHMNVKSLGRVYALLPNYLGNLALQWFGRQHSHMKQQAKLQLCVLMCI